AIDSGIYLLKDGKPTDDPSQLLLIKNSPNYNEQWPRALVPYRRIYGVAEPARLSSPANDGRLSKSLDEGSPYGLIGSSSIYKRETYPFGAVTPGKVTSEFSGSNDPVLFSGGQGGPLGNSDPFQSLGALFNAYPYGNWFMQGADSGKYENSDVHAIRIVI